MQSENSWSGHQIFSRKEQPVDKGNGVDTMVLIGNGIGNKCRISYEKLSSNKVIIQRHVKRTSGRKNKVWGSDFSPKRQDKGIAATA